MTFKIEVQHQGKLLTFGPRHPGQIGRDILAVKIALGLIKRISQDRVTQSNPPDADSQSEPEVPLDKQGWFDCQTGLGTDIKEASTFDLNMQTFLTAYQMKNKFLITCYLFEKFGIRRLLVSRGRGEEGSTGDYSQGQAPVQYSQSVEQQVLSAIELFDSEFGKLGEATLSVLHGWRPGSKIGQTGFVHRLTDFTIAPEKIIDIVPKVLYTDYFSQADGLRMVESGYLIGQGPDALPNLLHNNVEAVRAYKFQRGAVADWVTEDQVLNFEHVAFPYRPTWENTSVLTTSAKVALENTEEIGDPSLLNREAKQDRMRAFFYPDAFSTTRPFVINEEKLGFFYETDYELSSQGPLPSTSRSEIEKLEDRALREILDHYRKPKVWNFMTNNNVFVDTYLLGDYDATPEHSGSFPREIDEERVRNSKNYRVIELKIEILRKRIRRLENKKIPNESNRHRNSEENIRNLNASISEANNEIQKLQDEKSKLISGETIKRKDFWILSTSEIISQMDPGSIQSWRSVERQAAAPLIKFIEFRTPPLRPTVKYRALFEINRQKLDLIIYGDKLTAPSSSEAQNLIPTNNTPEDTVPVCQNLDPSESKRQLEELKAHARKKRRELARALKEKVQENEENSDSRCSVDLGVYGPFNLNSAFGNICGISGLSDEQYTKEALSLLTAGGAGLAEAWNIFDTSSENLQQEIDKINELAKIDPKESKEDTDRKLKRLNNTISMTLSELKSRVNTAVGDLREAAKVIERESIKFVRGSNFKANNEAQKLSSAMNQLEELLNDKNLDKKGKSGQTLQEIIEEAKGEDNVTLEIKFKFVSSSQPGPKNGKQIQSIKVFTRDRTMGFASGDLQDKFKIDFFDEQGEDGPAFEDIKTLDKFEPLNRPRTINYLSYIYEMTNPYPSSFLGFIGSFWDDKRAICADLGIDSEKGIAISLLGKFTSGITVDLGEDEEAFSEAFLSWAKINFVDPAKKWIDASAKNLQDSIDDTFDEDAALKAFGNMCTLEQIYDEFLNRLDLKSLLCDYLKCIKLPAFDFKLPSFNLPPWPKIPIIGWYGYLFKFLIEQFKQILVRILCTFARTIIDKLAIPFCEEQLEDFIAAGSSATPIMNQALADALTNTGITSGKEEESKTFFEDVTKLTTGQELCHLLAGKPLDNAGMLILRRLAEKNGLSGDLESNDSIANYFGVLGAYIPFEICEELSNLPTSNEILISPSGETKECEEIVESLRAIRSRLQSDDASLSDEEIQEALDIAQKNLDDRKDELEALSGSNLDLLLPPQFQYSQDGSPSQDLVNTINSAMPSFLSDHMSDTAKSLFTPAKSSYISALSNYVISMKIQSPLSPTAGDEDYPQESILRLETALEQLKNYTETLQSESPTVRTSADLGASSGLFEDARSHGLGNWESVARTLARQSSEGHPLAFLDPERDLESEDVRVENQRLIESLVGNEIKTTLKIKQILAAFTVFTEMGHAPLASYNKWYNYHRRDNIGDINLRNSIDEYGLGEWWLTRPGRFGEASEEQASNFMNWWLHDPLNETSYGDRTMEAFQINSFSKFHEATKILTDMPWYRAFAGKNHNNPLPTHEANLNEVYRIIDEGTKLEKRGIFNSFSRILDQVKFCRDLELINFRDEEDTFLGQNVRILKKDPYKVTSYREESLGGFTTMRLELLNKSLLGEPENEIQELISNAVELLYPRGENNSDGFGDHDKIPYYDDNVQTPLRSGDDFRGAILTNLRDNVFGPTGDTNVVGSPLFLTATRDKRVYLPITGFGTSVTEDPDVLADTASTHGFDLFIPGTKEDFLRTYPFNLQAYKTRMIQTSGRTFNAEQLLAGAPAYRGLSLLPVNSVLFKKENFNSNFNFQPERGAMKEIIGHPFAESLVFNAHDMSIGFETLDHPVAAFPQGEPNVVKSFLTDLSGLYVIPGYDMGSRTMSIYQAFVDITAEDAEQQRKNFMFMPLVFGSTNASGGRSEIFDAATLTLPRSHFMPERTVNVYVEDSVIAPPLNIFGPGQPVPVNEEGRPWFRLGQIPENYNENYYGLGNYTQNRFWSRLPRVHAPFLYLWEDEHQIAIRGINFHVNRDYEYPIEHEQDLFNDDINRPISARSLPAKKWKLTTRASSLPTNKSLYMKIVQLLSNKIVTVNTGPNSADRSRIPLVDSYCLQSFMMPYLQKRMEILEKAMIIYGDKEEESFVSVFEGVQHSSGFSGNESAGSLSIMPHHAKHLFQLFEIEKKTFANSEGGKVENIIHRRYYKRSENSQEIAVSYEKFIEITRDPLAADWPLDLEGNRVEFYLKPLEWNVDDEFKINVDEDLKFEDSEGNRISGKGILIAKTALKESYKDFVVSENNSSIPDIIQDLTVTEKKSIRIEGKRTLRALLLDDDQDLLIELAQLGEANNPQQIKNAYENHPSLLQIINDRIQHLSGIIIEEMQNMPQAFIFNLLPTISKVFDLIEISHPKAGHNLNAVYHLIKEGDIDVGSQIGLKFAVGPYTPGIKMAEYQTSGGRFDRYNVVVDSDMNLQLGFDSSLAQSPWVNNPDRVVPSRMNGADDPSRKIFKFCDPLSETIIEKLTEFDTTQPMENKRKAFAQMVVDEVVEKNIISISPEDPDMEFINSILRSSLEREVFDEVTSNIVNTLVDAVSKSPLFDEDYADELETRVSGRPIITESPEGSCVSNRYSLNSSSILSFDNVIVGEAFEEIMTEMSKPENSPFNRDFSTPEPFDRAMVSVSVKAFIRACLVDLLMKGGLAYAVWDLEPIVSTPLFLEYAKEHVFRELNKSEALGPLWGTALERSQGISNKMNALDSVVKEELMKFPGYSKQLFHPSATKKDFYNWFIYGKTLFPREATSRYAREGAIKDNPFFTNEGVFYRMPVPKWNSWMKKPVFGESHLGNLSFPKDDKVYTTLREFSKDAKSAVRQPAEFPTAKFIFEDYICCRGPILDYFDDAYFPDDFDNSPKAETDLYTFTYEEFSIAVRRLFEKQPLEDTDESYDPIREAQDPDTVLSDSEIKIGKRLTLLLNAGMNVPDSELDGANPGYGKIPEIIKRINSFENNRENKTRQTRIHRAYALSTYDEVANFRREKIDKEEMFASIPLTSCTRDLDVQECLAIRNFLESDPISPENTTAVDPEFYLSLSEKLSEKQGFKDYLDHLFPVRRFMTMTSIFSSSILGGFNDLPPLMNPTKSMIAFVALAASTSPEKRRNLISMDQSEFIKQVKDKFPGDLDDASCFEFPDITKEFFDAFWKELKRLMKYFPSILFRGIANSLDPAYKEMRAHYLNCDIRELTWTGLTLKSQTDKLTTGLKGVSEHGTGQNGKYVPIFPALPVDFVFAFKALAPMNFDAEPMSAVILKTVAYAYSGMLPSLDLSRSFKLPCKDGEYDFQEGGKYDAGHYGRYGHPISPLTALAFSTLQLPADKDKRKGNCRINNPEIEETTALPERDCDETEDPQETTVNSEAEPENEQ